MTLRFTIPELILPSDVTAISIYPNPFKNYTTISYNLPENGNVEISVYTIDEMHIAEISQGYHSHGENSYIWQPDNLQEGIYFVKIICGITVLNPQEHRAAVQCP